MQEVAEMEQCETKRTAKRTAKHAAKRNQASSYS